MTKLLLNKGKNKLEPMLRSINGQFAKEVLDFSSWSGPHCQDVALLRESLSNFGLLVLRRQSLNEAELVSFSAIFGEPEIIVRSDWASATHPEITRISNLRNAANEPIGGLGSGELNWHTDQSYMKTPATGAILHGIEVPENGPKTYWANLALAYSNLPELTKKRLEGKRGIFSYAKRVSGYDQEQTPEEVRRKTPDVTHALVNEHPVTGLKALYLDPATTVGVEGMPNNEGIAFLNELAEHATSSEFVYEHEWQAGDIVVWDNAFLLHRRTAFGLGQNRLLKRTTIRLAADKHLLPG